MVCSKHMFLAVDQPERPYHSLKQQRVEQPLWRFLDHKEQFFKIFCLSSLQFLSASPKH